MVNYCHGRHFVFHVIDTRTKNPRERCPNTELFLVLIFPHSDWIKKDTPYLSVFRPNAGKYRPEKNSDLDTFHAVLIQIILSVAWILQ